MSPIHPISLPGPTPEDILAVGYVTRWHTKPMAVPQSLSDHLAKVALLADWLGRRLGEEVYTPALALDALRWALVHDLPETEHGDIPNPAKRWLNTRIPWPDFVGYDDALAFEWWAKRDADAPQPYELVEQLVAIADILEAATRFWVFGLVPDLRVQLVFEAFAVTRKLRPDLMGPVGEVLAAAGVPDALIGEAAA